MSAAFKLCDVTNDIMTYVLRVTFGEAPYAES